MEINLSRTSKSGNRGSDDDLVLGENEESTDGTISTSDALKPSTGTMSRAAGESSLSGEDLKTQNESNNASGEIGAATI